MLYLLSRNASRQCAGRAGIYAVVEGRHDDENKAKLNREAEGEGAGERCEQFKAKSCMTISAFQSIDEFLSREPGLFEHA